MCVLSVFSDSFCNFLWDWLDSSAGGWLPLSMMIWAVPGPPTVMRGCLLRPTGMLCDTPPHTQNKQKYNKKDFFGVVESIDMLKYVNLYVPKVSFTVSEFHNTNIWVQCRGLLNVCLFSTHTPPPNFISVILKGTTERPWALLTSFFSFTTDWTQDFVWPRQVFCHSVFFLSKWCQWMCLSSDLINFLGWALERRGLKKVCSFKCISFFSMFGRLPGRPSKPGIFFVSF